MLSAKTNSLLYGIRPAIESRQAKELKYPHLKGIIHRHYAEEYSHIDTLWSQLEDANESKKHDYLLMIAQKLQDSITSNEKRLWSNRYTKVSISIYGKPEKRTVGDLAQNEFDQFQKIYEQNPVKFRFLIPLLDQYASLATNAPLQTQNLESAYTGILRSLNQYICMKYGDVLCIFDGWKKPMMPLSQIQSRFRMALDRLSNVDAEWSSWDVILTDSSGLTVNPRKREIEIGRSLVALPTARIKGLFAHEVLAHAQRSVNGSRYSAQLATGLEGYVSAEEGLGILVETAVNGSVPDRIRDRYVDISLAIGGYGPQSMTRHELYRFAYNRALARRLDGGENIDTDILGRITWAHVNRIYRGTLGNDFIGVFTRDISYYKGFCAMANYMLHRTDWGASVAEVIDYLMTGKFDPTDPEHVVYLREQKGK